MAFVQNIHQNKLYHEFSTKQPEIALYPKKQ